VIRPALIMVLCSWVTNDRLLDLVYAHGSYLFDGMLCVLFFCSFHCQIVAPLDLIQLLAWDCAMFRVLHGVLCWISLAFSTDNTSYLAFIAIFFAFYFCVCSISLPY